MIHLKNKIEQKMKVYLNKIKEFLPYMIISIEIILHKNKINLLYKHIISQGKHFISRIYLIIAKTNKIAAIYLEILKK